MRIPMMARVTGFIAIQRQFIIWSMLYTLHFTPFSISSEPYFTHLIYRILYLFHLLHLSLYILHSIVNYSLHYVNGTRATRATAFIFVVEFQAFELVCRVKMWYVQSALKRLIFNCVNLPRTKLKCIAKTQFEQLHILCDPNKVRSYPMYISVWNTGKKTKEREIARVFNFKRWHTFSFVRVINFLNANHYLWYTPLYYINLLVSGGHL